MTSCPSGPLFAFEASPGWHMNHVLSPFTDTRQEARPQPSKKVLLGTGYCRHSCSRFLIRGLVLRVLRGMVPCPAPGLGPEGRTLGVGPRPRPAPASPPLFLTQAETLFGMKLTSAFTLKAQTKQQGKLKNSGIPGTQAPATRQARRRTLRLCLHPGIWQHTAGGGCGL